MIPSEIAALIDHTLLSPTATRSDVDAHVAEAVELGVAAVCVSPNMLPLTLPDSADLAVAVVCGFPSGQHSPQIKAAEAELAVCNGADEIDMVINIGVAIERDAARLQAEIAAVREVVPSPKVLKVIIESAALKDDAIVGACRSAVRAGADFVKTSTGFHSAGGATERAVRLMVEAVEGRAQVKASGGVRTLVDAEAMIAAGATRLGVSGARALLTGGPSDLTY